MFGIWKVNQLSQVGRDPLIKSLAEVIPTYLMTVFKFLNWINNTSASNNSRSSWIIPLRLKVFIQLQMRDFPFTKRMGVSFRPSNLHNITMLSSPCWKFYLNDNSLWSSIMIPKDVKYKDNFKRKQSNFGLSFLL